VDDLVALVLELLNADGSARQVRVSGLRRFQQKFRCLDNQADLVDERREELFLPW
jgi:hypothetical protein